MAVFVLSRYGIIQKSEVLRVTYLNYSPEV